MLTTRSLTDKAEILAFLETDRLYAAYAIGDLEQAMFVQSTWAGAGERGQLRALVLHFRGLNPQPLFLMGEASGVRAILEERLCPPLVYANCRESHLSLTRDFYVWDRVTPMWRMVLRAAEFRPKAGNCVRLTTTHTRQLASLYGLGGGSAFGPAQVPHGVFYGVFEDGRLVATAGTHLVSPTFGVAAVGNVFTHPDCRGRGHAAATTSAVVWELLQRGVRDVVLNVAQDNDAAIRLYENLGFKSHCPFLEGPAARPSHAGQPGPPRRRRQRQSQA